MDVLSEVKSLISTNSVDALCKLYEVQCNELDKLYESLYQTVDGLTEDSSAARFAPLDRLCILPGQRIFPVRYLLSVLKVIC